MRQQNTQPFSVFGQALKELRLTQKKSYAEVSGAVEISEQKLQDYEAGKSRPSEDILMLLIQHFQLKDSQASELWRLAGYEKFQDEARFYMNDDLGEVKESRTLFVDAEDAKIVYTDMVQIMVNNYGVIMNFMQGAGSQSQPLAVSRVGMSKEHARSILELLKTTLEQAESQSALHTPRQLSAPKNNEDQ